VVRERLQHLADLGLGRDGAEQGAICSGAALVAELDELRRALGLGHLGVAGTLLAAHLDMAGAPRAGWLASTLPYVLRLAARLPDALAAAPPLRVLRAGQVGTASVSRAAAASLLAAAFLCLTPPKRAAAVFPHFTLQHVFEDLRWPSQARARRARYSGDSHASFVVFRLQKAKVDCFMYYFSRVASAPPPGRLLFTRMLLSAPPQEADWAASKAPLLALRFHAIGSLTDSAAPLKADFANEYLGGGAMGHGCVQEEILFVTWPELCVGALLCEKMRADEALLLRGAQRFSAHAGYHYGFLWAGGFEGAALADLTPDAEGVLPSTFVAFDALRRPGKPQFTPELMIREANKVRRCVAAALWQRTGGCRAHGSAVLPGRPKPQ